MNVWPIYLVIAFLVTVVFSSLAIGLWVGSRRRRRLVPENEHLGTIQGALLGLLGLILGFSFSGAMTRFIDRQDALWAEASAIENAYQRAEVIAPGDQVRDHLRAYTELRLQLFNREPNVPADELIDRMLAHFEAARVATYLGARQTPQFANLVIPGLEAVGDEFARRNAFDRRHLPAEMVAVLILSSCLSMGAIGYAVGLAQRRSIGAAITLAALVTITLFVTIDLDRPRHGFIQLDPTPLENVLRTVSDPADRRPG
jgi:hypothetical protein